MVNRLEGFWVRSLAVFCFVYWYILLLFTNLKCRGLAGLLFVAGLIDITSFESRGNSSYVSV